jgi:hypothetical protein
MGQSIGGYGSSEGVLIRETSRHDSFIHWKNTLRRAIMYEMVFEIRINKEENQNGHHETD